MHCEFKTVWSSIDRTDQFQTRWVQGFRIVDDAKVEGAFEVFADYYIEARETNPGQTNQAYLDLMKSINETAAKHKNVKLGYEMECQNEGLAFWCAMPDEKIIKLEELPPFVIFASLIRTTEKVDLEKMHNRNQFVVSKREKLYFEVITGPRSSIDIVERTDRLGLGFDLSDCQTRDQ